jgi:16S rRNA C967 or C1407 C5-methylase (RsmB/RsmF family)
MKPSKISFDEYYAGLFPGRWEALRSALGRPAGPEPFSAGLIKSYYLDRASVIAAQAFGPVGNLTALDLCAAPGGKTLVLASSLGPEGRIVANERSSDRRSRLRRVLEEHLVPELRNRITVTGHDATRWGLHERNLYDLVLLDAPCSSERHLIENPKHLKLWSPARTKHLAHQAYAMLLAALTAAKPGGRILYSTCSLSPAENDEVVRRAQSRLPGGFAVLPAADFPADEPVIGEPTRFGRNIWPDRSDGLGPIYFSLLQKNLII